MVACRVGVSLAKVRGSFHSAAALTTASFIPPSSSPNTSPSSLPPLLFPTLGAQHGLYRANPSPEQRSARSQAQFAVSRRRKPRSRVRERPTFPHMTPSELTISQKIQPP